MKKIIILLFVLIMATSLIGCNKQSSPTEGYTFTDDLGRTVTVNNPKRIAALLGSYADMVLLAGGEVCATVNDAWEDLNLDLSEDTINLGSAHKISVESLLMTESDFIIASSKFSKQLELKETLEKANIPVAYFDVSDFDSYMRVLKILTDITNNPQSYDTYGIKQQTIINDLINKSKEYENEQTVLVLRASAGLIRAKNSSGTMLGGMLKDFGCINIADNDELLLENLSIESIILENPDKIFIIETGDDIDGIKPNVEKMFKENPLWYQLSAVKNNKVYYMDKHLYNFKPNARFAEAYEKLEKILYEE